MLARAAAIVAALFALLILPSAAGANPSVAVSVVSTTNLEKLPATVTHRLTLTAGATDEFLSVGAAGDDLRLGGSAVATRPATALSRPAATCPGRWNELHDAFGRSAIYTVGLRIPAGTTAFVDLPITLTASPFEDETLDGTFLVTPETGSPFQVLSEAPKYGGRSVADMSMLVLRVPGNRTVLTGRAEGKGRGLVEIWAYAPGRKRARHLKTVHTDSDGLWKWSGWRPRAGRWELFTRYRTTRRKPVTGASQCGTVLRVRG